MMSENYELNKYLIECLDRFNTCIYAVNPETFEIIYHNKKAFNEFGNVNLIGETCFKALQKDTNEQCYFCPMKSMPKGSKETVSWELYNDLIDKYLLIDSFYINSVNNKELFVCSATDLSCLYNAREEKQKQVMRQSMIAKISIDFSSVVYKCELISLINNSMEQLGCFLDASRVYILKDSTSDNFFSCVYEWVDSVSNHISSFSSRIHYSSESAHYKDLTKESLIICESIDDGKYKDGSFLPYTALNTKSFVNVPIFVSNEFWGFLAVDKCFESKKWTMEDLQLIKSIAGIIDAAIERNAIESDLFTTKETLRNIINNVPSSVYWKDKNSVYLGCNKSFANYHKIAMEDVVGKTDFDFYPPEYADKLLKEEINVVSSKKAKTNLEREIVYADGSSIWLKSSIVPIIDEIGVTKYLVGITEDITKDKNSFLEIQKRDHDLEMISREAERANKAKTDFLSRMSHEIRTPMNAIIGMTRIAKETKDVEKIMKCLEKIDVSSSHLLSIINDILDMSKIEADKLELVEEEFNLERTLKDICNVVTVKADEKNINLRVGINRKLPSHFIGDSLRLTQVITNLLSNSIKFTPENGNVSLAIEPLEVKEDKTVLKFTVTDTGIGLTEEQKIKLFSPFEQADGGISRKYGGTGLGLAISKKIVNLMDGEIWVNSKIDKGSSFAFTVKLGNSENKSREYILSTINIESLKVLVVDDSEDILEFFKETLEVAGVKTDTALTATEAIDIVKVSHEKSEPYNIIFMDYVLPDQNGVECVRKMNALYGNNTVVILISAIRFNTIESEAREVGISKYLPKPLFPSTVINTINEILGPNRDSFYENKRKQPDLSNKKLLLAEDIEINQEILSTLLEGTKISIDIANNGKEAVDKFKSEKGAYDAIFMDIHMPIMDGFSATRKIREYDMKLKTNVPIIAMTANAFKEDIEKCIEAGMDDHVAKPIDYDIVIDKLTKYLFEHKKEAVEELDIDVGLYIDIDEGLKRAGNNPKLYAKLLSSFSNNTRIDKLSEACMNKDYREAKIVVQTMKVVCANLALTQSLKELCTIENDIKFQDVTQAKFEKVIECIKYTQFAIAKTIKKLESGV